MLVIVDTQEFHQMMEVNKKPLGDDKMFNGVWVYLIKQFIEKCPSLEIVHEDSGSVLKIVNQKTDDDFTEFEEIL
jgi:hypothetical protein